MSNQLSANEAMRWRYATKRMSSNKVPAQIVENIIDTIHLSPSSLGLQPYEIFVISDQDIKNKLQPLAFNQPQVAESSHLLVFAVWDAYTDERIENTLNFILTEKGLPEADIEGQINSAKKFFSDKSAEFQLAHATKQAAIALGVAVLTAALEGIDASSMEGFNPSAIDEFLGLKEKGLRSSTLMALGYRDEVNDWNLKQKKVRKPFDQVITRIS